MAKLARQLAGTNASFGKAVQVRGIRGWTACMGGASLGTHPCKGGKEEVMTSRDINIRHD